MSLRPKSICIWAGCQKTIDKPTYCAVHQQVAEARDKAKKNNHKTEFTKLYNWEWRKFRARYVKEHPLCVHCLKEGKLTPTQDVDHIIAHEGNKERFWDESNLQALCKSCHSKKTMKYDNAFNNRKRLSKDVD